MSRLIVEGGAKLAGKVRVQGSKNAAFPIMAACVMAGGKFVINRVPDILDVRNFLEILKFVGAAYTLQNGRLAIDASKIRERPISAKMMSKLRGSVLFAGAFFGRFNRARFAFPGGDSIGKRPIDEHLVGFKALGARLKNNGKMISLQAKKLTANRIVLGFTTVTGTENLILAAARSQGITRISLAASEPHVQALCRFLVKMGVRVKGIGTPNLEIKGQTKFKNTNFTLNSDEIDALTLCVAAAATKGNVIVEGADIEFLDAPLAAMYRMGVSIGTQKNSILIKPPKSNYQATRIITGVYPQLLTDEQPLFGVLATQSHGTTQIHDWIYEGRQGYLKALARMGAKIDFLDPHRAQIQGPSMLKGTRFFTPDVRAGASVLIAALVAKGKSIIYNAEIIDRGYEKLEQRLISIGANIRRVE